MRCLKNTRVLLEACSHTIGFNCTTLEIMQTYGKIRCQIKKFFNPLRDNVTYMLHDC